MHAQIMQQDSAQQLLANLQIVSAVVGDSGERSVDVVWSENGVESVQRLRESIALSSGIWIVAFAFLWLVWADDNSRLGCSTPYE